MSRALVLCLCLVASSSIVTAADLPRLQLARQLMAAALSGAAGGAVFGQLAACNAICADPGASAAAITSCIDAADAFNNGGDALSAPFDGTKASPKPCKAALNSACTLSNLGACTAP